jgi:hypothetical protein
MTVFQIIKDIVIIILLGLFIWEWTHKKDNPQPQIVNHYYFDSAQGKPIEVRVTPGVIPTNVPVYIQIPPQNGQPGRIDTIL